MNRLNQIVKKLIKKLFIKHLDSYHMSRHHVETCLPSPIGFKLVKTKAQNTLVNMVLFLARVKMNVFPCSLFPKE